MKIKKEMVWNSTQARNLYKKLDADEEDSILLSFLIPEFTFIEKHVCLLRIMLRKFCLFSVPCRFWYHDMFIILEKRI